MAAQEQPSAAPRELTDRRKRVAVLVALCGLILATFAVSNLASRTSAPISRHASDTESDLPSSAQSRGSFSVWTVPETPTAFETFVVNIQVRLPSDVTHYDAHDLSGKIVGTDCYLQEIRFKQSDSYSVVDGAATVKIAVPGAASSITHTLTVVSAQLRERQEFTLAAIR